MRIEFMYAIAVTELSSAFTRLRVLTFFFSTAQAEADALQHAWHGESHGGPSTGSTTTTLNFTSEAKSPAWRSLIPWCTPTGRVSQ